MSTVYDVMLVRQAESSQVHHVTDHLTLDVDVQLRVGVQAVNKHTKKHLYIHVNHSGQPKARQVNYTRPSSNTELQYSSVLYLYPSETLHY